MVWVRSPVYFYNRNGTYYFSRVVPSDLRHRFPKRKIEVSLRTKSESKAARSAAALSDRLERYWDSLRMEMIYSKELGLTVLHHPEYWSLPCLARTIRTPAKMIKIIPAMLSMPGTTPQNAQLKNPTEIR